MTNEQLWQTVLGEMELCVSKAKFVTWFKNTKVISKNNTEITISVPNGYTKEWLENKYNNHILKVVQKIYPNINKIEYKIGSFLNNDQSETENREETQKSYINENKTEKDLSIYELNKRYTFENFVVGPNNDLAHAACVAVSKKPGIVYNPLFIYGAVGLGKTHLLQSIGNEILKTNPSKKIKYSPSEKFANELIDAIGGKNTRLFKKIYRNIDVLLIDDIQFIAGKVRTQEEFFHTFNTLYENNKQIVISSDKLPKYIPSLEDRLRSRFEGGMIADIGFPDYETRLAILRTKARKENFEIPDESLNYIALHIQNNIRELQGALNKIIASCELNKIYPDINKTIQILSDIISNPTKKAITQDNIIKTVSEFYGISSKELIGGTRKKEIVKPRQIVMYLMRSEIKNSFPSIGNKLGGRDHTTAMHAYKKILKEIENDRIFEQEVKSIVEKIYNN